MMRRQTEERMKGNSIYLEISVEIGHAKLLV